MISLRQRHAALHRLRADRRGATIIEFAMVIPVFMFLLMGGFDLLHQVYAQSILDGALQKAARDSAIEGGATNASAFDQQVWNMVKIVAPGATYQATRKSYSTFQAIKPEIFTDKNGDGLCNNGEIFTDINGNGTWDADPGLTGQGGAEDVTQYTMTVTYTRLFPVARLMGWPATMSIASTTLLKNQPYDSQRVPVANPNGVCK
jgi:Flp pilus assembly protein TadG